MAVPRRDEMGEGSEKIEPNAKKEPSPPEATRVRWAVRDSTN